MVKVIKEFRDKETKRLYAVGEAYEGDRAEHLGQLGYVAEDDEIGNDNGEKWPKHIGGGNYELSNGEKIKGKEAALAAQAEIDEADDE
ncbi:MAG: hypothetical protein J7559_19645 [Cohnella sp.]|nr:hypothetical protein [Cohnella sp.]